MPQIVTLGVTLVAAIADNGIIGDGNRLIWRLKSDLKRFRALTMGTPMILGRKTFESIGKPLPGRAMIVLTRNPAFKAEGVIVVNTVDEAMSVARRLAVEMGAGTVTVAGGADIYAQTLHLADALRLTRVHASPPGDAVFPEFESSEFVETARKSHQSGPDDEFAFTFVDYERRVAPIGR